MQNDWTKVLGFPGYRVYQQEIDEEHQQLKLWIRRKRGNRSMTCAGCGRRVHKMHEVYEREIRDLPCFEYQTTVVVELYRVDCPACGLKAGKVPQLPSKSPYSKRFEDAVGQSCESASARQPARRTGLAESAVRGIDLRYLERCEARRRKPPLRHMGVDELYRGKKDKFLTVVCNLETAELKPATSVSFIPGQADGGDQRRFLAVQRVKKVKSGRSVRFSLRAEKIQNAVRNALVRGPQFVDALPQRICDRSAEFMTECRE